MAKKQRSASRLFFQSRSTSGRILTQILLALAFFALHTVLIAKNVLSPVSSAVLLGSTYLVFSALIAIIIKLRGMQSIEVNESELNAVFENVTLDFLLRLNLPVLICDPSGRIIWYNLALGAHRENATTPIYGKNLSDLETGVTLADIQAKTTQRKPMFGGIYSVSSYPIVSHEKQYLLLLFDDHTEEETAKRLRAEEETFVAYIIIDNVNELSQTMQERYRTATTRVSDALAHWAAQAGGFLKEYERDKFLFLFPARKMQDFTEDKFDILDTVREIPVGEEEQPPTVSIGVSCLSGTLPDKEKAAQEALDMALQRGGDQAVVKSATGLAFYGGRTKTVQKRTKVRARVVANELLRLIKKSPNVLIMGHRGADYDSIGACVGMARLAQYCGKPVHIIISPQNENLRRCTRIFDAQSEYRRILIDSASAQDHILANTLLIIVDVNNIRQFEAPEFADAIDHVVIIDHHRKTAEYQKAPEITYIEPSASSASELVAEILEQILPTSTLNKEEANLLLSGMMLDTKQFTRNTGARTYASALYLRNEGADPTDIQGLFCSEFDEFIREARFENNVRIYRTSIAIASYDGGDTTDDDRVIAAKVADKLLGIDGVEASFALCRIADAVHVSARSAGRINVQIILEKLGGGGYFDSAGAKLSGAMSAVISELQRAIDDYLPKS